MSVDYSKTKAIGGGAACCFSDGDLQGPVVHLSAAPFIATCGADGIGQTTTIVREHVTCPCCLGNHHWVGKQIGGDPTDAISTEWIEYCSECGMEKPGSGNLE